MEDSIKNIERLMYIEDGPVRWIIDGIVKEINRAGHNGDDLSVDRLIGIRERFRQSGDKDKLNVEWMDYMEDHEY